MKWILLTYLLLALFWQPLRRGTSVQMARLGHALALWKTRKRPWRVSWSIACRRYP